MKSSIVIRSGVADWIAASLGQYSLMTGWPFFTISCCSTNFGRYLPVASDCARAKSAGSVFGS
ncbi:Uncharacterised protein [Mycobacterium tuberculosis]|nr:Uncharacterised protein [Mycobacterium tuberculosis]